MATPADIARAVLAGHRGKQRIAAIAYRGKNLVAIGINSYVKTHPTQKQLAMLAGEPEREYLHAEIDAIIKAKGPIDSLFVFRIDKKGRFQNAKPCAVCSLAIKRAGIRQLHHS
jgi:deoxycytidylate deaminase